MSCTVLHILTFYPLCLRNKSADDSITGFYLRLNYMHVIHKKVFFFAGKCGYTHLSIRIISVLRVNVLGIPHSAGLRMLFFLEI